MQQMPTIKQKKVAEKIKENVLLDKPLNGGEIVESSGYGKSMRLYPGRILESDGVKEELKRLGFSIEAADEVIWNLLHKSEREEIKIKASQEIYKRMGGYAPEKSENKNLNLNFDGKNQDLIKKVSEEVIKKLKENEQ